MSMTEEIPPGDAGPPGAHPRSGYAAVLGWTNVGKSTLLNRLLGQKLAIETPKPQTTRYATSVVLTESRGQIVFVDTPGFHTPRHLLNEMMVKEAEESLRNSDLALHVVSPDVDQAGHLPELLRSFRGPRILVVNKIDLLDKWKLAEYLSRWADDPLYDAVVPVSAATGENTARLLDVCFGRLPEGHPLFPEDQLSDRNERFFMAEIIREKVTLLTRDEVPYAVAVVIEDARLDEGKGLMSVQATIYVEKNSQKSIVIGAGGARLKEIGRQARLAMEEMLGSRVYLQLWVKVRRNWTRDPRFLREIGYGLKR